MKKEKATGVAAIMAEQGRILDEEIEFFRGFGYSNKKIAERLGINTETINTRDRRKRRRNELTSDK